MRKPIAVVVAAALATASLGLVLSAQQAGPRQIRFVFTADVHYGITRAAFHGRKNVPASVVNAAEVDAINKLGATEGAFDFLAEGGDIANRSEADEGIQPAAASWAQFRRDYLGHLTLTTASGTQTPVYAVPGNHDVSNAIGADKPLNPPRDATSMAELFNLMMAPRRVTVAAYNYASDHIQTSRDIGGVHFVFLTIWPDAIGRAWLARDLEHVTPATPVVIFTHDPPDGDPKHFADMLKAAGAPAAEPAAWETFVHQHPNITAYFHGHNNWNEFYDWTGPHHTVTLHAFRADSPMKGRASATDETKLSFQVATIDPKTMMLTVRERLWNAGAWGASTTVNLSPAQTARAAE